ncbi:MAG: ketopantoate reductase family protein [Gammaproteobacteria bacterium]
MRFVVYGAGAIGGSIGARLFEARSEVVLVCRGPHLEAIRNSGLLFRTPESDERLRIPAVGHPGEIEWRGDDVVLLTMKTQDTEAALRDLEACAGTRVPIVCAQNGVANERIAARRFANVYAMMVALPSSHLEPGVVSAIAAPLSGVLHAGRFSRGTDETIERVCSALASARFASDPDPAALRLKYAKLLANLGNALEALAGPASGERAEVLREARREALACYAAAGIDCAGQEEYQARVTRHYRAMPVGGETRGGGSTWQSLVRGRPLEVDWLNGEIALLGALHGVPTPANSALRRAANTASARGMKPGPEGIELLDRALREERAA